MADPASHLELNKVSLKHSGVLATVQTMIAHKSQGETHMVKPRPVRPRVLRGYV